MTYRDRRIAKAERLREWADSRDAKAIAARKRSDEIADIIPMGQPILVGHHSENRHRRDVGRIDSGMRQSIEHADKADEFRRRADSIEAAAEKSVYSDDEDAIDKLRERIAGTEQYRDAMKRANSIARKDGDWQASLGHDPQMLAEADRNFRFWPGGTDVPFPNLKNVTAKVARDRKRLAQLETT